MAKIKSNKHPKIYRPKCAHCKRIFPASNQSALYCSGKCRTAAYRLRLSGALEFNRPAEARKLVREQGISYSEANYRVMEARSKAPKLEPAKPESAEDVVNRIEAERKAEEIRILEAARARRAAEAERKIAERAAEAAERAAEEAEEEAMNPKPEAPRQLYTAPYLEGQPYNPTQYQLMRKRYINVGSRGVVMVPEIDESTGTLKEDKFHYSFWRVPGSGERYKIDLNSPLNVYHRIDESGNTIKSSLLKQLGYIFR